MFSGRWEQCLDYDDKGQVFLDFDPYSFQQILSYLRSCNICSSATGTIPLPEIEHGKRKMFTDLVKYLSLEEYMGMGCLSLAKFVRAHPAVQILEEGQRAKLSVENDKYNSVVAELLDQEVGFWKVKIHQAKSYASDWIFLGIGQNINTSDNSTGNYSASSSYGWSSYGQMFVGGAHTDPRTDSSQVKWRNVDWILLKLDLQANRLSMLASGLASPCHITIQPAGQITYDFHVIFYNVGDEVEMLQSLRKISSCYHKP